MKVVITGCHGQLGQALQSALSDHEFFCVDKEELDITDQQAVDRYIHKVLPDLVINTAAYTNVDDAETDAEAAYRINEAGPRHLAQAVKDIDAMLLHVSTDYVFDGKAQRPYVETDETNPQSVYGKSKLAGERAIQEVNPRFFIVRTAWLYHLSGENFLRTMYRLSERPEVRVVNDQRGSPTNADDLADAIEKLIQTPAYGIHHLVNSGEASWYELTGEFYRLLGLETKVIPVSTDEFPRPAPRPMYSVLDTQQDTGIVLPGWQAGVARLVSCLPGSWKN